MTMYTDAILLDILSYHWNLNVHISPCISCLIYVFYNPPNIVNCPWHLLTSDRTIIKNNNIDCLVTFFSSYQSSFVNFMIIPSSLIIPCRYNYTIN